ncbi:TetR family transcriptional regulator [Streptomyces sp. NPDC054866]
MVKQDRARRTHELLLNAAAEEFVRHGYTGANLQRVAAQANMTKGALYAHFPSKEALATALTAPFERTWRELLRRAEEAAPAAEGAALRLEGALFDLALELVSRLRADLRFRAGFHLTAEYARAERRLPPIVEGLNRVLPELIRRAQACGDLSRSRDPETLGQLLLSLICGVYYTSPECRPGTYPDEVSALRQLVVRPSADTTACCDRAGFDMPVSDGTARAGCAGDPAHCAEMVRAPARAARSCGSSPTTVGCPTSAIIGRSDR